MRKRLGRSFNNKRWNGRYMKISGYLKKASRGLKYAFSKRKYDYI